MKLATNTFAHAVRAGEKQIGLWISLCSGFAADVIAPAGYDWAVLDMEHSPNDIATVMNQLQVFARFKTQPIVRPPWNDTVMIKRLLDIGAPALLFPMIQSVEEAKAAVAATRYPPKGVRGVSVSTRANSFGRVTDYFDRFEEETAIILQLETLEAISKAEEIGSVEGVDGVFFGPADIGADMGILGRPTDPAIWETIRASAQKLIAKGIRVGTLTGDPKIAADLMAEGFTFVACGSDLNAMAKAVDATLAAIKSEMDKP